MREEFYQKLNKTRRVVIKVGTALLADSGASGINHGMIEKLKNEIVFLRSRGIETLLVTSGAVGMGRETLREMASTDSASSGSLNASSMARRQALASIGQGRLISLYADKFKEAGVIVGQLLITARDFRDRRAYLNVGHTLEELIRMGILPVINENDTVSTDELKFGDNDLLSATCASLFHADLLIILTSVEGFRMGGERVPFLSSVTSAEMKEAHGPAGPGSGGMQTKIRAGQLCMMSGCSLAILPGMDASPVQSLFRGDDIGTIISGRSRPLSARKKWLLFARTEGAVVIDAGAREALVRGSSLLPAGIKSTKGRFLAGDVIEILDQQSMICGRGIANYSYRDLQPSIGLSGSEIQKRLILRPSPEVIHRNNMILEDSPFPG